jgi:hypothetical protein
LFEPSSSSYLYPSYKNTKIVFFLSFSKQEANHKFKPFYFKGEFQEPPLSPKPNRSSGYELHPWLIAIVQALPFLGHENKNPCQHLLDFKKICSCLYISGMTQETIRWKLFPFSLMGKAKQWYTFVVGSANGDWDELKDKFYLAFFTMSRIGSLPRAILEFEQREKQSIGSVWAYMLAQTCHYLMV